MDEKIREYIYRCTKLTDIMEEDIREIRSCLDGDVYDAYAGWIQKEQRILETIQGNIKRFMY